MKTKHFFLAVSLVFALAFIFGCSNNNDDDHTYYDNNDDNRTYYAASYGITNAAICSEFDAMITGNSSSNLDDLEGIGYSFDDVKDIWTLYRISSFGLWIGSQGGYTENSLRDYCSNTWGFTPQEQNAYMKGLNQRGNQLTIHFSSDPVYCYVILYVEKE